MQNELIQDFLWPDNETTKKYIRGKKWEGEKPNQKKLFSFTLHFAQMKKIDFESYFGREKLK